MSGRVEGKIAIVTGAASGIGRGCAVMLAREGAKVVVTDLDEAGGQATVDEIVAAGGEAIFLRQDVTDEARWKEVVDQTLERFGRLDILHNNAGVQKSRTVEEATLEDWHFHFDVNVLGMFLGTREAIGAMKKNGPEGGSIINTVSTYGIAGEELNAPYCASKGAARTFTKSAALHCGKAGYNIRVNAVHPGLIVTPLVEQEHRDTLSIMGSNDAEALWADWQDEHPIGRLGRPEDIAYGVLYLASDEASFVTGADLVIDGGYLAQ
jgi:3(or 17)beta-hydroxysteroid dehydrogenase